ncbi:LacI family DNA-binding transcriptional regulator [Cellulomonas soli]|uniref:LacI family DNA-binding transcriptional regulator n=1 Tax=Cellulomonas soli TaxID=931535 RepID=UPI003F856EF9
MVTMQDVADRAGVALSTVSAALNGTRPVAAATRQRVQEVSAELGYSRNVLAHALASRRSGILALTYPVGQNGLSRTVTEFVQGAVDAARDHGRHLVLWPCAVDDGDNVTAVARGGLAEGVLVMEVHLHDTRVQALREAGVPVALVGRTDDELDLPVVDIDFEATLEDAVEHLSALGHRRLGFVDHAAARRAAGHGPTVRAEQAYRAAMARRGLDAHVVHAEESPEGGRAATATLVDGPAQATALVVMNEEAGFGVVAALAERGLRVPQDVSVLSVVSSPSVARLTVPPLTTLHAPGSALGRAGVEALLAFLDDQQVRPPVLVPCRLVEGASTAPSPDGGPRTP